MDEDMRDATRLLAGQHGVAHRAQLRRLGLADSQTSARIASASWLDLGDGVVGVAGAPRTPHWRIWRAVAATGTREDGGERPVAVGGLAAATLHGCVSAVPEPVEVVVRRGTWCPRPAGVAVREVKDWADRRFVRLDRLLTTALPDTLVDVAPWFADDDYLALLQERCFGHPRLLGRVVARCHRGSKGSARARRVGAQLALGLDSPLHARAVAALRRAGLAPDRCDAVAAEGAGASDCLYVAASGPVLALEFDGDVHRLSRKAFLHDRAKDLRLAGAGCATLRFTVEQVDRPAVLVAAVRRALAAAGSAGRRPGAAAEPGHELAVALSTRGVG